MGAAPETRVIQTPHGSVEVLVEGRLRHDFIRAAPRMVLQALVPVYQSWGLDPDWVDPEEGIVGLTEIELRSSVNETRLSTFLHCGRTSIGEHLSDESRVRTSVVSRVLAEEDGTSLSTRVEAVAHPLTARSGQWHECTTTGEWESAIAAQVREFLGVS